MAIELRSPMLSSTPAAASPLLEAASETMREAVVLRQIRARADDPARSWSERSADLDKLRLGVRLFQSRLEHNHDALEARDRHIAETMALVEHGVFAALAHAPGDRRESLVLARATTFGERLLASGALNTAERAR